MNTLLALAGAVAPFTPAHPAVVLLLKITLVLLVGLAAALVLRRASAGSRHLVWFTVLGALLLLPPLAVWGPIELPLLPADAPAAVETAEPVAAPPLTSPSGDRLTAPAAPGFGGTAAQRAGSPDLLDLGTILLGVWAIVALALLARLAHGAWMVRRVVRRARALEGPEWQAPLYEIADRLGLDSAPQLLQSSDVKMPFAAGLSRATIVLPAESEEWSPERRSAVLVHELGHVRRRDLVGHTVSRIACALYWFHPLVWTAARHLRAESERACDDLALVFGARPSDYAEHLLDIVTCVRDHHTPAIALAMAHRGEFEGRMLAILNPELTRRSPGRREAATTVALLASLALLVGAAAPVRRALPAEPRTTLAQVQSDDSATASADTGEAPARLRAASAGPAPVAEPRPAPVPAPAARPEAAAGGAEDASQQPGGDRVEALARALRSDSSARVREVAAWGLQRYARTPLGAEALARALTSDTVAAVREMAAWALAGAQGNTLATDALVRAMRQDRSPRVRETAVWAAGSMGDRGAIEALTLMTADPDAGVREEAAWALATCGPEQAPAPLVKLLADDNREVRMSAAWALYQIGDPATAAPLEAAFRRETDSEVRMGLIRALGTMGDQAVATLERLVTSPDPKVREVAITALAGGNAGGPWPWPRPRPRPSP